MGDNKDFENAWFSQYISKTRSPLDALTDVRDYAYAAFDRLDTNHNGLLELKELEAVLNSGTLESRERSFVSFLLSNHDEIAEAFDEGEHTSTTGISRQDLSEYFKLVLDLLKSAT